MITAIALALVLLVMGVACAIELSRCEKRGRRAWGKIALPIVKLPGTAYRGDGAISAGFRCDAPRAIVRLAIVWLFVGQIFWGWVSLMSAIAGIGMVITLAGGLYATIDGAFAAITLAAVTSPLLAFGWLARRAGRSLLLCNPNAANHVRVAARVAWLSAILVLMGSIALVAMPGLEDETLVVAFGAAVYAIGFVVLALASPRVLKRAAF